MAAVEVTISGVLYDKLNRTMQQVVLIGEATLTGLGVGGGPMPPGPGQPPSWGPGGPPHPAFPIAGPGPFPPGPGYPPVVGGGPIVPPDYGPGGPPRPAFPIWGPPGIEFPPGPGYPPVVGGGPIVPPGTPPQPNWKAQAVWTPEHGWGIVLVPVGGQPIVTPSA